MTDTKALREKIEESGLKYGFIAEKLGLSRFGLKKKIDNDSSFKAEEIQKMCEVLSLTLKEREEIFFVMNVGK